MFLYERISNKELTVKEIKSKTKKERSPRHIDFEEQQIGLCGKTSPNARISKLKFIEVVFKETMNCQKKYSSGFP